MTKNHPSVAIPAWKWWVVVMMLLATVVGDVVHVLMQRTSATELRSIQFVPGASGSPGTYQFWSTQPNLTTLPSMAGLEAVVFEIDTTGKMWVAYENGG